MIGKIKKKWPHIPLWLVWTRSCDKPDIGVLKESDVVENIRKYAQSNTKKVAEFLAFRDRRFLEAKKDGYLHIFCVDNDRDEEGLLPDSSNCWSPLIKHLSEISPKIKKCISDPLQVVTQQTMPTTLIIRIQHGELHLHRT
eukprot:TRINITY_DN2460_c0_g1_i1.p1 TRINITY_DN2460_c0_g1~~TRINITY_DN2460_c0_g1_i1.p1  ORF type:complete len:141 (-),score=7.90 TRINITY_DN2460_c0_g1_i1:211-633(-)